MKENWVSIIDFQKNPRKRLAAKSLEVYFVYTGGAAKSTTQPHQFR